MNSNTSHVLINRWSIWLPLEDKKNSNTSHVLINHGAFGYHWRIKKIQIHLMFLLIADKFALVKQNIKFKYISCSY